MEFFWLLCRPALEFLLEMLDKTAVVVFMGGFSLNFSFKCRGFNGLINDSFAKDSSWSIGVSFGIFFGTYKNVWSVKDCYIGDC